jgi:hypothetical protein
MDFGEPAISTSYYYAQKVSVVQARLAAEEYGAGSSEIDNQRIRERSLGEE